MPDIRITCGIADSLFISTSSLPPPRAHAFSLCLSRGALFLPRGVADKAVADRNLPIRFYLPHCAPVFSPAPFLSVSYPFSRCLCPSLRTGLGRVKILAWGRPAGRFAPGDTRRYIFPSVTMHRTSSKQRVWSIHQPVNIHVCMCVSHQSRSCTPGVPADIGETGMEKEIPGRYGPSRN